MILALPSINCPLAPQRLGNSKTHTPLGPAKAINDPSLDVSTRSTSKLKGIEGIRV